MTPQTTVGLVLIVLGIAVKVAAAAGWLPGDITFIGEIMALGTFLLGKELAPASAAAQAKRASKYPPVALALPTLLLLGCAGTNADAALENRLAANELRAHVNEAAGHLEKAHGALPFVCAYVGPESATCLALEDGYRGLAAAINMTHEAIDLLDSLGIGAQQSRSAAERVLLEAQQFGAAVHAAGSEVANALERNRRGAEADRAVHEEGPAPAAAEGGAPPAAAATAP